MASCYITYKFSTLINAEIARIFKREQGVNMFIGLLENKCTFMTMFCVIFELSRNLTKYLIMHIRV